MEREQWNRQMLISPSRLAFCYIEMVGVGLCLCGLIDM
uniref:Uncharacterized protein n=1 Tax=Arundo donax TaxID=35708 RepID=A0A0A9CGH3_ARUDO